MRDRVASDLEIHDERFLAADVRGPGTTLLTACSHAGVVNVGLEARRLLPDQPIDLLLAVTASPAQASKTASNQPSATSPHSSNRGSSPPDTAPTSTTASSVHAGFVAWELPHTRAITRREYAKRWRSAVDRLDEADSPTIHRLVDALAAVAADRQFEGAHRRIVGSL